MYQQDQDATLQTCHTLHDLFCALAKIRDMFCDSTSFDGVYNLSVLVNGR